MDENIKTSTVVKYALMALAVIIGLTWVFQGNDFYLYKVFAPKQEQVRRETYEQSRAFIQGTIDDLRQDQRVWISGDAEQKKMMRAVVLHKADQIKMDQLPDDLQTWITGLRQEANSSTTTKPEWK